MYTSINDLSSSRILLSNDDGINAPGLAVLERIARDLTDDVWIVAPSEEQSGVGHSLTLRNPLRPTQLKEKKYMIDGTPTDCVLIAIQHIMKDHPPDLVLSGINMGENLGEDVHYSGTIAAALEATLQGVPAIALSQTMKENIAWETVDYFAPGLVRSICKASWNQDTLININFPDCGVSKVKGVKVTRQGKHKVGDDLVLREDPRGRPYMWIGAQRARDIQSQDSDLRVVADGYISVTPLNVDLTDVEMLESLSKALG
ncbi:MAG: 5'/3'-nucleotidase SurE [Rhodospirillaceae bacterium]